MQTVRVDQLANVLAEAVRDGVRLEQERIIKLLKDFDEDNASCQCCFTELCVNDVIALIKGDTDTQGGWQCNSQASS